MSGKAASQQQGHTEHEGRAPAVLRAARRDLVARRYPRPSPANSRHRLQVASLASNCRHLRPERRHRLAAASKRSNARHASTSHAMAKRRTGTAAVASAEELDLLRDAVALVGSDVFVAVAKKFFRASEADLSGVVVRSSRSKESARSDSLKVIGAPHVEGVRGSIGERRSSRPLPGRAILRPSGRGTCGPARTPPSRSSIRPFADSSSDRPRSPAPLGRASRCS